MTQINKTILKNIQNSFKEFDLIKARSGVYKDTPENRRLNRVGLEYGMKKDVQETKDRKVLEDFSTKDRHSKNGIYSDYRKKIHKEIKESILKDATISEKPTVLLIMGGVASGKTSSSKFFRDVNDEHEKTVLEADRVKLKIPEYHQFAKETAAPNVHKEANDVANSTRKLIVDNKINFVNDGTMKNTEKAVKLVNDLKKAGYHIKLINVSISVDEAKKREAYRFKETGRKVPEDALELSHIGGVKTYEALKGLVNEYLLLDNNVPFGKPPVIVDSDSKGITHQDKYDAFLEKVNYKRKG